MWKKIDKCIQEMFRFTNGKKVILWGYRDSGWFIEHLFKTSNKKIDYIVDDFITDPKTSVYRSMELKDLDSDTHVILLSFMRDKKVDDLLISWGYVEKETYIYLKDIFFENKNLTRKISYQNWLEYEYGMDIVGYKGIEEVERVSNDSLYYSPGIDYALMDVINNFCFDENDAVFDFGCGKGGALLLFERGGIKKLGGVEYDSELYSIACKNFDQVGLEKKFLYHEDAASLTTELDEFNYFFIYNSFQGELFRKMMHNLEESYKRKKRKITFIYSGPYCHHEVVKNNIFKFSKQIYTDYAVKRVNVYITN